MNNRTGTVGTVSSPHQDLTRAHVYNKVKNKETKSEDEPEELLPGSKLQQHCPLSPQQTGYNS
ncbi:hypothetical protein [Bacteroides sp.]|uniref:hypothetical protein n=1 Tax=Bacteroides sp. TaxID=29523 RepID=UPI00260CA6FE|nr:hypothetical protein [Bacteroides sp.]MDD3036708.1 hypothetical protein [Bacteroides sp.]